MSAPLKFIRILSDGRAGHFNQSYGLAEALRRRTGAEIECVQLDIAQSVWSRVREAQSLKAGAAKPQLLISAGHTTHVPMLAAARVFDARTVVIMKPSLPVWLFDLCAVPRHDVKDGCSNNRRMLVTQGALNRISEDVPVKSATGLILVGGPSRHHEWAAEPLLAAIAEVVRKGGGLQWIVTDSRRTPAGFIERLAALDLPGLTLVPHTQTAPGWLPKHLLEAQAAWVTEDSISMIYESITAGARTGLLPMPAKAPSGRIARAVEAAVLTGDAIRFSRWQEKGELPAAKVRLHEAARCADEVLARFFSKTVKEIR
jgi:uncharacterized protein